MADVLTPAGKVDISPSELAKSAAKIRKELLKVSVLGLGPALRYFSVRTGIRYSCLLYTSDAADE